jgi:hypothetical protein
VVADSALEVKDYAFRLKCLVPEPLRLVRKAGEKDVYAVKWAADLNIHIRRPKCRDFLCAFLLCLQIFSLSVYGTAAEKRPNNLSTWYQNLNPQWGGYLKTRGAASWYDDRTLYGTIGSNPYLDGSIDGRLKNQLYFGDWGQFETHYEIILFGGDTRRKNQEIEQRFPNLDKTFFLKGPVNDNRRFFDLTAVISEDDEYVLYHRLDRLALTLLPTWGVVRAGRQAVTWGNGFLFNPMDLFNPFAPTDVDRDYKLGDDLLAVQFSLPLDGDMQFLLVPRRDSVDGDVESDQSSLAGKLHLIHRALEFDLMVARHYEDDIIGIGGSGYLGAAAWRMDATYTLLDEESPSDSYLSLVANIDYSWMWSGKNYYGFLEFFFNGLGEDTYAEALTKPDIVKRLARGELFTLGRAYLSGMIQMEVHPLLNIFLTIINNLADPSGVIQPRATWDIITDLQLNFGGNIYYGDDDTEYGGFQIPNTPFISKAPNSVYLWLTYYF